MSNTDLPGSFSTLSLDPATAAQTPRIAIESVTPAVDNGQFAAKGIAGRVVEVTAKIFADGHDKLAASVLWRQEGEEDWQQAPLTLETNDLWRGRFTPPVHADGTSRYRLAPKGAVASAGPRPRDGPQGAADTLSRRAPRGAAGPVTPERTPRRDAPGSMDPYPQHPYCGMHQLSSWSPDRGR